MEHKCNVCFYKHYDKDKDFPCNVCDNYNKYVNWNTYAPYTHRPLTEAVSSWKDSVNGMTADDYDVVSKPKHYMLFADKGIEVRDVIEKLVDKIKTAPGSQIPLWEVAPLFEADYVQMMQYLMRFMDKNGVEDLKKARWYLDKLIQSYEQSDLW